jgi:dTDP-4-dehydrorhamnose 3,5-epimerase
LKFIPTSISGAFVIEIEELTDNRGYFSRTVCREEFTRLGLNSDFMQQSISYNHESGVLRGLHYQAYPYEEQKLVRVTAGAIYDVIADIRPESATYCKWIAVELSAANHRSLYIPMGVVHGFQTLTKGAEILYQMTVPYHAAASAGIRWDDPVLNIDWPNPTGAIISDRDRKLPLFSRK